MSLRDNDSRHQHHFRDVSRLTPYFRSRDKQRRICPRCHEVPLEVWPTLNPNVGIDRCPKCRYFQAIVAPKQAQVPNNWTPPTTEGCKIIPFERIRKSKS